MQERSVTSAAVVLAICAALAGCSRSQPPAESTAETLPKSSETAAPGDAATIPSGGAAAVPSGDEAAAVPSGGDAATTGEIQLAGLLGCGHCSFHVTSDCAASIKTTRGEVYVLDGVQEGSELWEKRLEGSQQISVTGAVLGTDKVKHVAMTSFDFK